tara:strand:- start:800 stop:1516 length:717 start_codon:yes stop_codon:yes gene_type:complete
MAFRDVTTRDLGPKAKKVQKMAAEELLMSVIPVARIGKLAKLVKGLNKGSSRKEVSKALKEGGFDKLASTKPSQSELNRQVKVAQARKQAADTTRTAKEDVKFTKYSRERDRMEVGESKSRDKERRSKAIKREVQAQEDLDKVVGRPPVERKEAMRKAGEEVDDFQRMIKNPEVAEMVQRSPSVALAKRTIAEIKKAKTAEEIEKKVNRLADLSDTIAKNAAKRKEALRKAAEAKAKK